MRQEREESRQKVLNKSMICMISYSNLEEVKMLRAVKDTKYREKLLGEFHID
ncbi:MAG: hypothetical protein ACLSGB_03780 [Dorea sp.]